MKHYYPFFNYDSKISRAFFYFSLTLILFVTNTMQSQGETCAAATLLTVNGACDSGPISDNIQDTPNIGSCAGTFGREGWYTFTVSGGPILITITANSSGRNLFLQLISSTSSCTGLSQIACANADDTANSAQTETISQTLNNGTYYVKVVNVGSSSMTLDSICITSSSPCVAPSSQASGFTSGTITSTAFPASFTGSANGYLVIRSLTSTPPTQPANGTIYSAANIASLGTGLTFVQTGTSTAITGTGLTGNTQYYYFIYAYNNTSCTGGPAYNTSSPLTGNAITCPAVPNSVATASVTASGFTLNWATPTGGSAAAITYTVQVTTDAGYTSNVSGSPFSISAPTTTLNLTGLNAGTIYYYRILANNGCSSAYVNGNVTTTAANPCSSAITLDCGTTNLAGTTVSSTNYTHGSGCSMSNYGKWYTFIGDGNLNTISVTTTNFDPEMSISSGSCGSLTNVTCQDIAINGTETYSFTATVGVTYYVYVAYYLSGDTTTGTFTISRTCTTPFNPCASIPNITACGTTTNVTISAGTGAYSPSSCGWTTAGNEQIYTFTPSATGNYSISQSSSFAYIDYQFKPVSSGGCSGTSWTCIDDISGSGTSPNFTLTAGVQYYLLLDPESTVGGNVSFVLNCPPVTPTNNDCSGAIALTVNPSTTCTTNATGTTLGATQSQVGCQGTADDDVWYSFVATGNSHTVTITPTSLSDAVIQAFSGSCGSLVSLDCVDDTISSNESIVLTGLTIGNTYYVRVYSFSSTSGQGTFNICVTSNIPCTSGNGIGGTSTNCPIIVSGGLGLNGADPNPINACVSSTCVNLEATYLPINQTTSYTVQSLTNPAPFQYGCLANSLSINVDDVWSPTITLPFNFCFYGTNYTQCLIGSNGTITFDLTNNAPGGYNDWSFADNLPNNTLFLNTIFGVYHDIDPSKGGEVGWELITLTTGCRALVASWKDIPMFSSSCNNQLYTGMIVLYENTNIIEVYIEEKNVCATWNGGNAIVGIQNANATQFAVAPGRNGLDTDWTTTNEAWRFTPSGTSTASIKWYQGAGTGGTVVGTTSTLNICPTSTTTYTAEITYSLCSGSTLKITDQTTVTVGSSKVWNGSVDNDWNKQDNWTPNTAIPNNADCVIIPITGNNPVISGTGYNGLAGTLTVQNGAALTINADNSVTVTDWVNVGASGTFTINNDASLVQINNVANTGNIIYKRDASVRSLDYVYWSSPVAGFNVSNIASPLTSWGIYKWNTIVANTNGGQGNWENAAGNTMIAGKGYIASGPSSFSSTVAATLNGVFTGIPNNGNITIPIERGSDINTGLHYGTNGTQITNYSDNWNLLGNPYPSAIRGSQFLYDNNTKIMGNIRLWTHGTLPTNISSPFYGTFIYNYSPGDYLTYNFTGTSCCPAAAADLFIGSGQGFFVQMVDGTADDDTITFTNSLRSATYSNSSFYRFDNIATSSAGNNIETLERNRIWLDIISADGQSERTLFGYIQEATMADDNFFDCKTQNTGSTQIYSLIDDGIYSIQGRSLPFDINDEVPIGVNIPTPGNYSIALAAIDGLFNQQDIYLKDDLLNVTHDLKTSPYPFTAQNNLIKDRFKIVYISNALGNPDYSNNNNVRVVIKDDVSVSSNNLQMESIVVYNLLGQKLDSYLNINTNYFTLTNLSKNNTGLLLKIKLQTGETVIRKVIY